MIYGVTVMDLVRRSVLLTFLVARSFGLGEVTDDELATQHRLVLEHFAGWTGICIHSAACDGVPAGYFGLAFCLVGVLFMCAQSSVEILVRLVQARIANLVQRGPPDDLLERTFEHARLVFLLGGISLVQLGVFATTVALVLFDASGFGNNLYLLGLALLRRRAPSSRPRSTRKAALPS